MPFSVAMMPSQKARVEGSRDFRHRLNLAGGDGEDVGDAIDQHADDHIVDFGHDDGAALVGDGALHAELVGEVDDRDNRAAQVHDTDDVCRSSAGSAWTAPSRGFRGWWWSSRRIPDRAGGRQ